MKKKLFPLLLFICLFSQAQFACLYTQAQFTSGNLVVSCVGNGSSPLNGTTTSVSLLEFNTNTAAQAVPINTIPIGSTIAGTRLTLAGTIALEGQLSRSADGRYLSLVGYDVASGEPNTNGCISSIRITTGGSGYTTSSVVTISGGGGSGATAVVNSIGSDGAIATFRITNTGSGYTSLPTVTVADGTGFTGTATRIPLWQGFTSNKVIARIDNTGTVDYSTRFQGSSSNASGIVRNAISVDGSKFWIGANRLDYVTFGQTTAATQIAGIIPRYVGIFKNQLYYTLALSATGFNRTNTPLAEAASKTTALPLAMSTSSLPSNFVFLDLDPNVSWNNTGYDVLYIAETTAGLEKYYWDGTNWTPLNSRWTPIASPLNNTISPVIGLCAITALVNSAGNPVIYAIGGNGTAVNNSLYAITDATGRTNAMVLNAGTTITTLATAGANYAFKGVAFTPVAK